MKGLRIFLIIAVALFVVAGCASGLQMILGVPLSVQSIQTAHETHAIQDAAEQAPACCQRSLDERHQTVPMLLASLVDNDLLHLLGGQAAVSLMVSALLLLLAVTPSLRSFFTRQDPVPRLFVPLFARGILHSKAW